MIDNGRRTCHNHFTSLDETIYTVSVDFVPAAVRQPRLGTDDLPDAYRGLPVILSPSPLLRGGGLGPAPGVALYHPLGCGIWAQVSRGQFQPFPPIGCCSS